MSLLTSAGCNSSLFQAALRNPPGRGAAFYYHPLSEEGQHINHYNKLDQLLKTGKEKRCMWLTAKQWD